MEAYVTGGDASAIGERLKTLALPIAIAIAVIAVIVLAVVYLPAMEGYRIREFAQRGITSTVSGVPDAKLGGEN